ncbi:MAG: hypothetical protein IJ094_10925 [Bacilli bacterium]|nr:hypothetical protein [Bacilli bacterium]
MKECKDCNVEMIENTNLHTDYVGGVSFEEQIYLTYTRLKSVKTIFGKEKEKKKLVTERVKARYCPNCGKVELYIDTSKFVK